MSTAIRENEGRWDEPEHITDYVGPVRVGEVGQYECPRFIDHIAPAHREIKYVTHRGVMGS